MTRRTITCATALLLGLVALSAATTPAAAQRRRLSMDPGWRCTLGTARADGLQSASMSVQVCGAPRPRLFRPRP